ncbi:MotA/TolQ/ExbB proton channel family protein [Limnobacter sp.]|uniref:MotA/TolQ/ExbB proton channel family protein n=1 Tax=Limnobacter sp. TaxID=2003368 RepID=UPI003511A992
MWAIITAAGWPIWPLIFASIIALGIIFERCWALRESNWLPPQLVADVCRGLGNFKDKQNLARLAGHSPLGAMLAAGIVAHARGESPDDAMQTQAGSLQANMEKHLDVLSMIASAAPLMGLLGTVIGMIEIFAVQGSSVQSPEAIAAGIAVALYNTAFGLIVAIPALVAYRLFRIRINTLLDKIGEAIKPFEDLLEPNRKARP